MSPSVALQKGQVWSSLGISGSNCQSPQQAAEVNLCQCLIALVKPGFNCFNKPILQDIYPPVTSTYLGGEVLGRAAERSRCVAVMDILLAQPKIGNLDVTIVVEQEVLQLKDSTDSIVASPMASERITVGE